MKLLRTFSTIQLLSFVVLSVKVNASLNVTYLTYFPPKGKFVTSFYQGYQYNVREYDLNEQNYSKQRSSYLRSELTVEYAVIDRLLIAVNVDYNGKATRKTDFKEQSTLNGLTRNSKSSAGVGDLNFLMKYQLFVEEENTFDLSLAYSPGFFEKSFREQRGNHLDDGESFTFGSTLGVRFGGFEVSGKMSYIVDFKQKRPSLLDEANVQEGTFEVFMLHFKTRYHFDNGLYGGLGVGFALLDDFTFKNKKNKIVQQGGGLYSLSAGYLFRQNSSVELTYDIFVQDFKQQQGAVLTSNKEVLNILKLGLIHQF